MEDYELLHVKKKQLTTALTEQIYFEVKASDRFEALCRIIDTEPKFYSLIFCRTKSDVDELSTRLQDRGYDAEPIHGDISQHQRERTLAKFKQQRATILVATDVAARGIDVNNLTHVINFALPQDPESYVHRIGRTGRAGKQGTAITFITPSEYHRLMAIQRFAKTSIKKSRLPRVEDIIEGKKRTVAREVTALLDTGEIDSSYFNWAKHLLETHSPTELVAAVLNYCFEDELDPDIYGEIREPSKRSTQVDRQGKTRLFVALGKKDGYTISKLVDTIAHKAKLPQKALKDVQVMEKFSFITVAFNDAETIIRCFKGKGKGKRSLITHAKAKK
jgi:ATP-dependent RNA helicase DeaD